MSSPAPVITGLRARAVDALLAQPIRTAVGSLSSAPLVLIDVATDQDIVGRAYLFGYTPVTLRPLVEMIAQLDPMVRGKTVAPVERMRDFDRAFRLLGRQGLLGMALSGLDMAFWDVLGRAADLSVARLLGGEDRPIPAYDNHGVLDLDRDAPLLERYLAQGFEAIKIKIGGGAMADDLRTVAAVRPGSSATVFA